MSTVVRPGPLRWVLYSYGVGLPQRNREWVLYDVTTRTWVLRHLARTLVQIAPFAAVVYLVIPGEPAVRLSAVLIGAALGFFYSVVFVEAMVEHRAIKAGFPEGTAAALRKERRLQK